METHVRESQPYFIELGDWRDMRCRHQNAQLETENQMPELSQEQLNRIEKLLTELSSILRDYQATHGIYKYVTNPEYVFKIVTEYFKVTRDELMSRAKPSEIVWPRQVCQYLLFDVMKVSLNSIARTFKVQHKSIVNNVRVVKSRLETKQKPFCDQVEYLKSKLQWICSNESGDG